MSKWKLKLDDDGKVVLKDNFPVYADEEGKAEDIAFDPNKLSNQVLELRSENKRRREQESTSGKRLGIFKDIEDLEAWKAEADTAIEMVQNFKDKDKLAAEKVEKLKSEMKVSFEEQENKLKEQFQTRESELNTIISQKDLNIRALMVGAKFATSPLFSGSDPKTIVPPDMAETYFGKRFRVENKEDGTPQLRAYDANGEVMYSRKNIGDFADFDEAMEIIFDQYPGRDRLIRSTGGGSGDSGGYTVTAGTPLDKLNSQLKEAQKTGNIQDSISIKNQIYEIQKQGN